MTQTYSESIIIILFTLRTHTKLNMKAAHRKFIDINNNNNLLI